MEKGGGRGGGGGGGKENERNAGTVSSNRGPNTTGWLGTKTVFLERNTDAIKQDSPNQKCSKN
eukprot:3087910-Pyramimonas_sp.AAC.1